MEAKRYKETLETLTDKPLREKNVRVAGIITDYVKKKHGIDLIVVGGLSVEFYTNGGYTTQDIDFVGAGHDKIMECLVDIGFTRQGKDSFHEELKVYVEVPSSTLKDGEMKFVNTIETIDGFQVNFIGIEDIVKDRLRAFIHWKEVEQLKWISIILEKYGQQIDREYIRSTLTKEERTVFNQIIYRIDKVEDSKSKQYYLKIFMDESGIWFNEINEHILALYINGSYFGFSLYPDFMVYNFNEEESDFHPLQNTPLELNDVLEKLSEIPNGNKYSIPKLINKIEEMYGRQSS